MSLSLTRREFLLLAALGLPLGCAAPRRLTTSAVLKPPRLFEGATVGLISPGGVISDASDIVEVEQTLAKLGLNTIRGRHVLDRHGYLAGTDQDRAADLNRMFADPDVDAVLALRGGWGCNRILPLLDYDLIRSHPKILLGYSDITSLLIALYARSGLVTFHGPVGISTWNDFSVDYFRRVLFDAEAAVLTNPRPAVVPAAALSSAAIDTSAATDPNAASDPSATADPNAAADPNRIDVIRRGTARGRLVGGNLSVLVSMIGSPYVPDWRGHILFLEDVREDVYRVDRMLSQLALAGILDKLTGVVFGKCTRCDADPPSLSLQQVLHHHIAPLGIPAFYGSMIGHITDKFTVPVGVNAEIDAEAGEIRLLEPAVT